MVSFGAFTTLRTLHVPSCLSFRGLALSRREYLNKVIGNCDKRQCIINGLESDNEYWISASMIFLTRNNRFHDGKSTNGVSNVDKGSFANRLFAAYED